MTVIPVIQHSAVVDTQRQESLGMTSRERSLSPSLEAVKDLCVISKLLGIFFYRSVQRLKGYSCSSAS